MSRQIIQRLIDFFSSKTLFYVFRSHQFAFSIDGGVHSLILSGSSETDSQLWMRHIRDLLWPRSNPSQATNLWPKQGKIITYQKKISIDLFLQWKWKDFRLFYSQFIAWKKQTQNCWKLTLITLDDHYKLKPFSIKIIVIIKMKHSSFSSAKK